VLLTVVERNKSLRIEIENRKHLRDSDNSYLMSISENDFDIYDKGDSYDKDDSYDGEDLSDGRDK
jgi:hypothetical protein